MSDNISGILSGTGDVTSVGSVSPSSASVLEGMAAVASTKRKQCAINDRSRKKLKPGDRKKSKSGHKKNASSEEKVDLSSVKGQLSVNPKLSLEQAKFEAKREHHRQCAARARLRSKERVESLQHRVVLLSKRSQSLERENEILKAQLQVLLSQKQQPQQPHHDQPFSHAQMSSPQASQQDFASSLLALFQSQTSQAADSMVVQRALAPVLQNNPSTTATAFATQQQAQQQQAANATSQLLTMPQQRHNLSPQISQGSIQTSKDSGHASYQQQQQNSSEQQKVNIKQDQLSQSADQLSQKEPLLSQQERCSEQAGFLPDEASQLQEQLSLSPSSSLMTQLPSESSVVVPQQPLPPPTANSIQQGQDNVTDQEGQQQQMQLLLQQMQNPEFAQLLSQVSPEMLGNMLLQLGQVPNDNNLDLSSPPN